MSAPTLLDRIDDSVRVFVQDGLQRLGAHHDAIEALAADVSLTEKDADFRLIEAKLRASLTEIAVGAAAQLDELGPDMRDATRVVEHFLIEHGLLERPSFGTISDLMRMIGLTVLAEELGTAAMYAPAVGWPGGVVIAALIAIGVTIPGLLAGIGFAAARHRLQRGTRLLGLSAIAVGGAIGGLAIVCGAHFRALVVDNPRLAAHPIEAMEAIGLSLGHSAVAPFFDPGNLGLALFSAAAWGFTAWKTYRTFGYFGWRELALAEAEARDAIVAVAEEALDDAEGVLGHLRKEIKRLVSLSIWAKWLLERLAKADKDVRRSGEKGMAIGAKYRSAAYATLMQVLAEISPTAWREFQDVPCPASTAALSDREPFQEEVRIQIKRHDELIADECRVLPAMADTYQLFAEGLRRARAVALLRDTVPPSGPVRAALSGAGT